MSDKTGISWTDATWNPVRGCSPVSPGCGHCYAEQQAGRIVLMGKGAPTAYDGLVERVGKHGRWQWTGVVRLVPEHLADPLRWRKPKRVFVNSMSDLFHENLGNEQIAAVFGVMAAAPWHTFQVLTKRADRMLDWFRWAAQQARDCGDNWTALVREAEGYLSEDDAWRAFVEQNYGHYGSYGVPQMWPLPNVWLGVSVENQEAADERIEVLLQTPAEVRFLSCEPLLGPVDLHAIQIPNERDGLRFSSLQRHHDDRFGSTDTTIDWVIAGCESGPGARPADVAWFRTLRDQCAAAGVPFFLKQAVGDNRAGRFGSDGPVPIGVGHTSKRKAGSVIELPLLDGVQHAAFPEVV